ncbi:hypothetical protein JNB_18808 [Janibacter sp. HTCC2649]|uniref:DUF6081 family protein n=1 Tax=Janibacter sp. HTCC2649 TaxID=313589 RepID=UPI0000670FCC|nr:DUF6081 family protein [Janibacter sp. HTCC2649]EAP97550.1 hypothetical protein JNB_18808 [Janibacter sp. HTCC2649]
MPVRRHRLAATVLVIAGLPATLAASPAEASKPSVTTTVYDTFDGSESDYAAKWDNPYGPGEMAAGGTRTHDGSTFRASALPFRTGADFSVFDHIKYLGVSRQVFTVPDKGSVTFSLTIDADTVGTDPAGRVIHGVYGPPGCADDPACAADAKPWQALALEGQQAGATLHMIDFRTGQLFDWFVSGTTAFALIERLPATVIGSPDGGTRDTMYTQIIKEIPVDQGPHRVSITFSRNAGSSHVDYTIDGKRVARVGKVGVPLDVQKMPFTGIYPSLGVGEDLREEVDSVAIGHGLFSLLDAFPFQHPDAPEHSVSVPMSQRLFGQGAAASFDDMVVTIDDRG